MKKKNVEKEVEDVAVEASKIESAFDLVSLTMKEMRWSVKLGIRSILPRSYHQYKITLQLNEKPWLDRIDDFEAELNGSLFKNEKTSKKDVAKKVAEQRKDLDETRKVCEKIEFSGIVESLKYKNNETSLEMRIPDDVIQAINQQKVRLPIYKISLVPTF